MFRLESYITPIILNYVAKYVKNVRPQDAQVSLWEGEVAFQNLDLRLDVLEYELNLPFEFLSGHIHELIIHVPWTKINSEPINITINTIEFVLKLKDLHGRDTACSPTDQSSPQKEERKKRPSRLEESQPGYNTSGLVSKIINNITIDCHNIILKYVEDDIVVSMNVQLLSFHSVDENWIPAFVDIHPINRLLRKVIKISDLTICLDKRNSMGHIEVCQEPILYKCSLQIRLILESLNGTKKTRFAVLTNLIEMNVSSLQFPMALRLLNLILALKTGEFKMNQDMEESNELNDENHLLLTESSWSRTMWNMLPNIFSDPEEESKMQDNMGNILDVGLYVESFKFTLKSSEFINESIVGTTKKIRYNPIVSFLFNEIFLETVVDDGKEWFSSKIGISKINVEALGHFCEEAFEKCLIKSNSNLKGNFLFESLFDDGVHVKDPITGITEYLDKNTEEYLNHRAACFNLNITKYRKQYEGLISENNVCEIIYRLLVSSMTFNYNTTACKIIETVTNLIAMYDYPPYVPAINEKDNKLPPPILEDYDSLMAEVPVKTFNFCIRNLFLKIFPKEELYIKNQNRIKTIQKIAKKLTGKLPFLSLNVQFFSGKWITPQDPDLLVHTTCQLPKQPVELLNACYDNFFVNVKDISIELWDDFHYPMLLIPSAKVKVCNLLYPHLWQQQNIAQLKMNFSVQDFIVKFTKPRLLLTLKLIKTIFSFDSATIMQITESSIRTDIQKSLFELEIIGKVFEVNFNVFDESICTRGRLRSVKSNIIKNDSTKLILVETMEFDTHQKSSNGLSWIEWSAQFPKNCENFEYSTFLFLNLQNYNIFLNESFAEFLHYSETGIYNDRDISPNRESRLSSEKNADRKSIKKSAASSSRKISHPEETIHLSSEKDEGVANVNIKKKQENSSLPCRALFYLLKFATLNVNINQGAIYFVGEYDSCDHNYEIGAIWTPRISCKSSISENFDLSKNFPIKNSSSSRESFPWTCNITSFSISLKTKEGIIFPILCPVQTNITVAMNHKKERVSVSNCLFTKAVDQIQERCDRKTHCSYEDNSKKKIDLVEHDSKEDDIQSTKCDWSKKEYHIDCINRKSQTEKDVNNENLGHVNIPSNSPKRIEKSEICDLDLLKAFESHKIEKDTIGFNFHIDTSPILFELKIGQVDFLRCKINLLSKILGSLGILGSNSVNSNENFRIVTDFDDDTTVKEFLEMDSCSDSSTKFLPDYSDQLILSTWLQWTVTKIALNIGDVSNHRSKMTVEMEDFIISLDKQVDYIKIKSKLGTFSMRYFKINDLEEVHTDDDLKFNMKTNNSELPFIDITVTIADTKSVFRKIGAHKKADLNNQLYEIIISIQAFETTVNVEKLLEFLPVISFFTSYVEKDQRSSENIQSKKFPGSQLPLIYFELGGFTVYVPVKNTSVNCSVFILNVNEVKLSPNVKNPLTRKPVRSDVYNKAAQMGLLNVRGSIIEDRQYELIFYNISIATGNWFDFLSFIKDKENNLRNVNPAFDWNHQKVSKTTFELQEIFDSFVISVTFAPIIVYQNVVVSGQSVEFNCITDLNAKITTEQIRLFSNMSYMVKHLIGSLYEEKLLYPKENVNATTEVLNSEIQQMLSLKRALSHCSETKLNRKNLIGQIIEERDTDSGISTYERGKRSYNLKQQNKLLIISQHKFIPYEISFLAGVFTLEFYHVSSGNSKSKTKNLLEPLFICTVDQPSMLISQKVFEKQLQASLHNLTIDLSRFSPTGKGDKSFPVNIFNTFPGKLNISGIPPSLFLLKIYYNKLQKCNITCLFSKPIKLNLQHKTIEKLTNIWVLIDESAKVYSHIKFASDKEIIRGTKLKIIKKSLANVDTFSFKLDRLVIKTEEHDKYEIEIILDSFKSEASFIRHPEKLKLKLNLDTFYIKTENKICLHPLSIKCDIDLTEEKWSDLPLISGNLKINVVQIDLGIENLQNILNALDSFTESVIQAIKLIKTLETEKKITFEKDSHSYTKGLKMNNLQKVALPKIFLENENKNKEEFYQDDLRAGAFQFVETDEDSSLPLPYQIHIITKNHGIICWRYPQPRRICKLHIFPIPMPINDPMEIKCQVEYFSELYKKFLLFREFSLSETKTTEIELPRRIITANIWRVVILQPLVSINREYFDTSEEDDEVKFIKFDDFDAKDANNFTLHPKVLVGCMKIDTSFNQEYVPKVQVLLDVSFFELNLQNQQTKVTESVFKNLILSNELSPVETFLSFNLKNLTILTSFLSNKNYTFNSEVELCIKVLDYAFSNMQFLIEDTSLKNYLAVEKNFVLFNFISDVIKINMDPGILHTMVVSIRQWNERIASTNQMYNPIITRFVVANMVQHPIVFGQSDTNENIYINSKEYIFYSFISSIHKPQLTFYNPQKLTEFSEPFHVKMENSIKYTKLGENIYIIDTKKLSSTQVMISIKGQVEFLMMVEEKFMIHFRNHNADGTYVNKSPEYFLNTTGSTSFCHCVLKENPKSIRIKFDSNKTKLWSGDIPLKANKNLPWLVKIPLSGPLDFVSYWFRIISEDIIDFKTTSETPLRILIMVWPIFQIKSFFPKTIYFTENSTNTQIEIPGRASILDLKVPATHETEHVLTFNESFPITYGETRQMCSLSLKNIDWNQFFQYDEKKWTINKCLEELEKPYREVWPYKLEEESKIYRKCDHNEPSTIPVFKIGPSKELSCSLLLEVAPCCIFINSLSSSIKVKCLTTDNTIQILSNELNKLFPNNVGFIIEVDCISGWISSLPIYFDGVLQSEKKYSENILLKDNDEVEILFSGSIVHKAILQSIMEDGRKILIIKPVFVLSNYSDTDFYFIPFCLLYNHRITRKEIKELTAKHGILIKKNIEQGNVCGLAIDAFYNLNVNKNCRNKNYYIFCITMYYKEEEDVTIPINLAKPFNRKCISLQNNNNSIALSINCLENNGQYYLNVFNDSLPAMEIRNWTDLNLLLAQTDSNENSADVTVKFESNDYNFEWHQMLRSTSTLFYTPPEGYLNFPDNGNITYNIVLAFFNEESPDKTKPIRWSKPLRTNISCEKFFNIPMFGDVKIAVCVKHKVVKINISYIAEQLEFSVKDLRSRLLSPTKPYDQHRASSSFQITEHISQDTHTAMLTEPSYKKCDHDTVTGFASTIEMNFFIKDITLSFSTISNKENFNKSEILAVYFDDLIVKYDSTSKLLQLVISNIQIDNQQFSSCKYDFPVVLSSQDTYMQSILLPSIYDLNTELNIYEKTASIIIKLQFRKEVEILELTSIFCKIKPIRAYIEDTYINDLLEILTQCAMENLVFNQKNKIKMLILSKGYILIPDHIVNKASYLADPIRLECFRIEPLSVLFSVHTCIRFYIALDHTPLELAAFERKNITTLPIRLGYIVGMHYLSGALFGAGWVVGSLEILGSPSGLARCVTTGIRDFVTLPLEGFFRGPWGFLMGVTQGSVSLLRNITAGTVNSVTKLASSVARNIDRLTFDEEHFQRTEIIRRTRPQGFAEGLSQGLTSLGINILGAVGGLARHPLEAQTPAQIVTGVGKGIVGAFTKPLSGAAELVALTGHGVLHTVGFNTQPRQRSPVKNNLSPTPANSKIWKLLPRVLKFDQILFFHEATLVAEKKLKHVTICMTSTVLAILELDKNELTYVLPIERVMASFDENDSSLINVNLKPKDELVDEFMNKQFARSRIMDFLRSSRTIETSRMSIGSLEDLLIADKLSTKLDWSFYISENLGHHLLQYLKIVTPHSSKDIKHRP